MKGRLPQDPPVLRRFDPDLRGLRRRQDREVSRGPDQVDAPLKHLSRAARDLQRGPLIALATELEEMGPRRPKGHAAGSPAIRLPAVDPDGGAGGNAFD